VHLALVPAWGVGMRWRSYLIPSFMLGGTTPFLPRGFQQTLVSATLPAKAE